MRLIRILFAALAVLAVSASSSAQTILVDYDSIRTVVTERPEVYRQLTQRFVDADTSLSLPDLAVVYYGRAFTPSYNPDESYADVAAAMDRGDLGLAMTLADEALRSNPVALPMLFKLYGLCSVSDQERLKERIPGIRERINMLCTLIEDTGNGVNYYSPWAVICEADMNEFLTKYIQVQRELDRTDIGDEKAVKVRLDGVDDDVILYFDLLLPRRHKSDK